MQLAIREAALYKTAAVRPLTSYRTIDPTHEISSWRSKDRLISDVPQRTLWTDGEWNKDKPISYVP